MKTFVPLIFFFINLCASASVIEMHDSCSSLDTMLQTDRKLDESEVKQRGIGILVTEVIDRIDEIDLRKMARSSIFETSYGFRWKMYNVQTSKVVIIKVNKNFRVLSIRDSKNT